MKITLSFLVAVMVITSCSSPKYAYRFDTYDYNSGKNGEKTAAVVAEESVTAPINANELMASTEISTPVMMTAPAVSTEEVRKTYLSMTKSERKEVRKTIKNYLKEKKDNIKAVQKTNAMDNDLKLAAIFGAVGLVALIIGGDVFWIIGGIAMIVGVVFFVKWLVRQ
ncbi:MAG: hypothetical protein RIB47_07845 [Cyclobacteriaceae bacterium]